ncbi:MAG: shikimate dehydrogenase family protein [Hyphomicrobiaceae bacterium]
MIGAPITSVRTPGMLEARMAVAGIEAHVDVRHVEPEDLAALMRKVRYDSSIDGLMVTMPHKRNVLSHLARVSSTASLIGSVNAVKRMENGELAGAQFDGIAVVRALTIAGFEISDASILMFGFGGAGTAIAHALLVSGCRRIAVHDEAIDKLAIDAALRRLAMGPSTAANASVWNGGSGFDILVNATPLGMKKDDASPFAAEDVAAAKCVVDIVADPPATELAEMVMSSDATLVTGRDMVAAQIDPIFDWLVSQDVEQ